MLVITERSIYNLGMWRELFPQAQVAVELYPFQRALMPDKSDVWFGLGCNLEEHQIAVMGFASTQSECDAKNEAPERLCEAGPGFTQFKSFKLDDNVGSNVDAWLKGFAVPGDDRKRIINQLGKELLSVMQD